MKLIKILLLIAFSIILFACDNPTEPKQKDDHPTIQVKEKQL